MAWLHVGHALPSSSRPADASHPGLRRDAPRRCRQQPDSEQLRFAPRTCGQICERLSLREIDHLSCHGGWSCQLLRITGIWPIGLRNSRLRVPSPPSRRRCWRSGWNIWRSQLGSVSRQKCGAILLASEISVCRPGPAAEAQTCVRRRNRCDRRDGRRRRSRVRDERHCRCRAKIANPRRSRD